VDESWFMPDVYRNCSQGRREEIVEPNQSIQEEGKKIMGWIIFGYLVEVIFFMVIAFCIILLYVTRGKEK
jgi:hypothetical protein